MRALRNHAQSYAASGGASSISGVRLTYPGMWRIATFTGRNGYFAGGSITHGNKTDFYDARGLYQGSATRQSTSTTIRSRANRNADA